MSSSPEFGGSAGLVYACGPGSTMYQSGALNPVQPNGPAESQGGVHSPDRRNETAGLDDADRFRLLAEAAPVLMWMTDANGRRTYVNRAWCEFTGVAREKAAGFDLYKALHPDDARAAAELYARLRAAPGHARIEGRVLRRDGEYRWLVADLASRFDESGVLLGFIGCSIDVTEAKRAEQSLRESEERFRLMAESTPAYVRLADAQGSCRYVNRRWCEFTGRPFNAHLGEGWTDAIHPDDREALRTLNAAAVARREPCAVECRVRRHDGEYRYVLESSTPHFDDEGRIIGVISSAMDVTERKRMEERLRDSQKMEAVGQLAAGLAHDFGNLLTAIFGHIELARGALEPGHPARLSIEHIAQAATQASVVTRALLTFSRRAVTEKRPVELNTLLRETSQVFAASLPVSIKLEVRTAGAPVWVSAEPSQLQQALLNLALNARDAMPRGGLLSLSVARDEERPESAVIIVRDTGEGMTDEVRRRAFEPFFTTKPRGQSTGLGLSISEGIIREMGGSISVDSTPGAGSVFTITLRTIRPPEERPDGGESAADGASILVVSEQPHARLILSNTLDAASRSLRCVRTLDELGAAGPGSPPADLVVLDTPPEGGSAAELLGAVRAVLPESIVVLLVGPEVDSDEVSESRTLVVRKPIRVDALRELIGRLLRPSGKAVEP